MYRRRWTSFSYPSTSDRSGGRGPTRLMSPRKTLTSCGSSSREYLRRVRPTRVTRGSCLSLKSTPLPSFCAASAASRASASTTIERNLNIWKVSPLRPTRSCVKITGPPSSSLMKSATTRNSGISSTSAIPDTQKSKARFNTCLPPSNCGISTWMRGRPSTGRKWMRGPATSVSRDASTSSVAVPSSCQASRRMKSRPLTGCPATITVSTPSRAAASATPVRSATTGTSRSGDAMRRFSTASFFAPVRLPVSSAAPTTL